METGFKDKAFEYFYMGIIWVFSYFAPTFPVIILIGFFVFSDTITGIMASLKEGNRFESKKLRSTVGKLSAYGIAVLVAHVVDKNFLTNDFPGMKLISGFICFIEIKSINENIEIITKLNLFQKITQQFKFKSITKK